jgi:hypothetical protein
MNSPQIVSMVAPAMFREPTVAMTWSEIGLIAAIILGMGYWWPVILLVSLA